MGVTPYVSTGRSGRPRSDPTQPDPGLGSNIKIDHEPAQLAVADDTIFAITDGKSESEESTAVLALR